LSYRYQYEYKKLNQTETLEAEANIILNVFLRFEISFAHEFKQHFESIQESYSNQDYGYIIGNISLSNIRNISDRKNTKTSFVLFEIAQNKL
jgi:homoserine dehydrogenase